MVPKVSLGPRILSTDVAVVSLITLVVDALAARQEQEEGKDEGLKEASGVAKGEEEVA